MTFTATTFLDRASWLVARRSLVTATDVPAILGEHPWQSSYSVGARKIHNIDTSEPSLGMDIGLAVEDLIITRCNTIDPKRIYIPETEHTICISNPWPWLAASLDGYIHDPSEDGPGVCEVKTISMAGWGDEPPSYVQLQAQTQLAVTGYQWAEVLCYSHMSKRLRIYRLNRDADLIHGMIPVLFDWYQRVIVHHEMPEPDGSDATTRALNLLYPQGQGTSTVLTPEFVELDAERESIKAEIAKLEGRKSDIDNHLRAAIGNCDRGTLPNCEYSWRTVNRKGYTVEPKSYRELRRKERKDS